VAHALVTSAFVGSGVLYATGAGHGPRAARWRRLVCGAGLGAAPGNGLAGPILTDACSERLRASIGLRFVRNRARNEGVGQWACWGGGKKRTEVISVRVPGSVRAQFDELRQRARKPAATTWRGA
jgi:hypothetical protein